MHAHVHVHTRTRTHIYIHIYVCICIRIYLSLVFSCRPVDMSERRFKEDFRVIVSHSLLVISSSICRNMFFIRRTVDLDCYYFKTFSTIKQRPKNLTIRWTTCDSQHSYMSNCSLHCLISLTACTTDREDNDIQTHGTSPHGGIIEITGEKQLEWKKHILIMSFTPFGGKMANLIHWSHDTGW